MIRIAVSPRAYRAIKGTLPEGSVVLKPERDGRGRYSPHARGEHSEQPERAAQDRRERQ
jgi:hypothetical protein